MLRYSIDLVSLHQLTGFRGSEEVIDNVNLLPNSIRAPVNLGS
jgi:hypothetical protein